MGVSENRGPQSSTKNSKIHIIRTPNNGPLISGSSQTLVLRRSRGELLASIQASTLGLSYMGLRV